LSDPTEKVTTDASGVVTDTVTSYPPSPTVADPRGYPTPTAAAATADPRGVDSRTGVRSAAYPFTSDRDPRDVDPRTGQPYGIDPRDPRGLDPRTGQGFGAASYDPRSTDPRVADLRSTDPRYGGQSSGVDATSPEGLRADLEGVRGVLTSLIGHLINGMQHPSYLTEMTLLLNPQLRPPDVTEAIPSDPVNLAAFLRRLADRAEGKV